jgi:hypothetical protein
VKLDPKSVAAALLREHDNPEQALRYAERKAATCTDTGLTWDYMRAAEDLREYIRQQPKEQA